MSPRHRSCPISWVIPHTGLVAGGAATTAVVALGGSLAHGLLGSVALAMASDGLVDSSRGGFRSSVGVQFRIIACNRGARS